MSSPRLPDIPGLGDFKGASFHTSEWRKDLVAKRKRIAVIGTGAYAVQVIPHKYEFNIPGEWRKDFAPKGKRIAVIGTGASA